MKHFFFALCLLPALLVSNGDAAASIPPQLTQTFGHAIEDGRINIRMPEIAENGAVVPIDVADIRLTGSGVYVTELLLYTDYALDQPFASFKFTPDSVPGVTTRIKLARSATVFVVARLSDGRVLLGSAQTKITIGSCGSGSGDSHVAAPPRTPWTPVHGGAPVLPNYDLEKRERYGEINSNPVRLAQEHPVSTFSIDVDTASYANVRRFLNAGNLPPTDAVRVEELINYFSYGYAPPRSRREPFAVSAEMARTPWNANSYLLRLGLKGYEVPKEALPPANLVFLVDVSGSMFAPNRLPLVQKSLRLLVQQLSARDRVSLVVYAGHTGVVLEPTQGDRKERILAAIDSLSAGGSTNGGAGIRLAYEMARRGYIDGGINRVILATDGDFNVGVTSHDELIKLIRRERESKVFLTTLGFGMGNYNDRLMEQLADAGNGNHAYIDSLNEARKVLVEQMSGTLHTIAKDVKIQVEFNPAAVAEYRLIGYENRLLKREDFNNDKVDAGDIGAGHNVTALYEITLKGDRGSVDPLRYGKEAARAPQVEELAWLKLRFKAPEGDASKLLEFPLQRSLIRDIARTSDDFRFAASVAAFGQILRGGEHTGDYRLDEVLALARKSRGEDESGYRGEFVQLVDLTRALMPAKVAHYGGIRD